MSECTHNCETCGSNCSERTAESLDIFAVRVYNIG